VGSEMSTALSPLGVSATVGETGQFIGLHGQFGVLSQQSHMTGAIGAMSIKDIWRRLWRTWPHLWPVRVFRHCTYPVPPGLWLLNLVVQRVFRVNDEVPWMVHFTSRVIGDVKIGRGVWRSFALSGGCYIQGVNGVRIGDDTIFAPGVKIISANHQFGEFSKSEKDRPIVIGRHCWLGANAIVLPGVHLGDNVVVGAGAVVTRDVPEGTVVAGVPAVPIKSSCDSRRVLYQQAA